jgi:hypothetical protein
MDKNRTFTLDKSEYIQENNDAVFHLKNILDGSYSITMDLKLQIPIQLSIRVENENMLTELSDNMYFYIKVRPRLIINGIDKQIFKNKRSKLEKGTILSSTKLWNIYWYSLHWLSFNYPVVPGADDKQQIMNLTSKMMKDGINCLRCKYHFTTWNNKHPIKNYNHSREELIKWYVDLHNDINTRNNKPVFTMNEVKNKYVNFDYSEIKDKYRIDIIQLFYERKLESFPTILYNVSKKILWKEFDIFQT